MAQIQIPHADNPFSIGVMPVPTQGMGLSEVPNTKYGIEKVTAGLAKAMNEWQAEVDNTLAQDLINELHAEKVRQQTDPETGWANQKGVNALQRESGKSLAEEAQTSLKESYDKIRKRAGSSRVKEKVDAFYKGVSASLADEVNVHVNKQFQVYEADVDQVTLRNAISMGLSDDPVERKSGIEVSRTTIDKIYKKKGLTPDYSQGPGLIHSMYLEKLIDNGRLGEARVYLKENGSELDLKQKARVKAIMDTAAKEAAIESAAQKIIKDAGDGKDSAYKALKVANQLTGKNGKRINALVKQHYAQQQEELRLENKEREAAAWDCIMNGKPIPATLETEMRANDPQGWQKIEKYRTEGQAVKSDTAVYSHYDLMADMNPTGFAEVNLDTLTGSLSKKDLDYFRNRQKNLNSAQYEQYMKEVNAVINADKHLKKDPEAIRDIKSAAVRLYDEQRGLRKNGVFTPDELSNMARSLTKGETEGLLWNSKQPLYQQMKEPKPDFTFGVDTDKLTEKINKNFPFAQSYGFSERVLKKDKKAKRIAEYYYQFNAFPPAVVNEVANELRSELKRRGVTRAITFSMINQAAAQKYFGK